MDTKPIPLDQVAAGPHDLRDFLVDNALAVRQVMQALHDAGAQVHLNAASGAVYTTTVWTLDTQRETLVFATDGDPAVLERVLAASDVVAVSYLDNVKLQFDVTDLVVVRGPQSATLGASFPQVVWRFQRRGTFRAKASPRTPAQVRLRHPKQPGPVVALRLLDVSQGGCAVLLPADLPPVEPGTSFSEVALELDGATRLTTGMLVQHVTPVGDTAVGLRLGCAFAGMAPDSIRSLQRWIDNAQRRMRFLTIT